MPRVQSTPNAVPFSWHASTFGLLSAAQITCSAHLSVLFLLCDVAARIHSAHSRTRIGRRSVCRCRTSEPHVRCKQAATSSPIAITFWVKSSLDYRVPLEQSVNMRWLMVHFNLMSNTMPTTHSQTNARSKLFAIHLSVLFFADCWIDARRSCQLFVMLYFLGCPFGWLTLLLLLVRSPAFIQTWYFVWHCAHEDTHTHTYASNRLDAMHHTTIITKYY